MGRFRLWLREFYERFMKVRVCAGCRTVLPYERSREALCEECLLRWNRKKAESCPDCLQSVVECRCCPKNMEQAGVVRFRKLLFYLPDRFREPQNRLIYWIKRKPNRRLIRFAASELLTALQEARAESELGTEGVIVSIPRSSRSRMVYGFDQSEMLGKELERLTGLPYKIVFQRKRGAVAQKTLNRAKRKQNLQQKLVLTDASAVSGKDVFLLDDIVTTGASMEVCAGLLKKAGAKRIVGISLAYTKKNTKQ